MNKELILIVEDELLISLDLKEIFTEQGYEDIVCVENVEDAIKVVEIQKPILILLDINLKRDKDGINLGEYLLEKDKAPFMYVTSYTDKITLDRALETRPYGFIVKPYKSTDVITAASIIINNFKHRNIDVIREDKEIENDIPFLLKKSIKYINENITEKINVIDLAKQTRWESQHFNRLFTKYVGVTPYQYILIKKVEKAKILLTETSIPIVQVSYELGFKSHSNFCSIFKKAIGKTPENFRKWNVANENFVK